MTTATISRSPFATTHLDAATACDALLAELVERELGRTCDDPDEFDEIVFRLGLAA